MPAEYAHSAVMEREVVEVFSAVPQGLLVDATVGGGGHALALLESRRDIELLGLDRDPDALEAAATSLAAHRDRVTLRHARFDNLASELRRLGRDDVCGVLFDLGVSSPQLDRAERGFSYRLSGPLDMRMDRTQPLTASDVVNGYDEKQLALVLRRFGDEQHATRIARAIVAARPIHTTTELAETVRRAIPARARRRGGHPARRTFQAIRIEVNEELAVLADALQDAIAALAPLGRCVAISYHSGEDRLVKQSFLAAAGEQPFGPPGLPELSQAQPRVRLLWRRARRPGDDEIARNPRSKSARMRAVERIA